MIVIQKGAIDFWGKVRSVFGEGGAIELGGRCDRCLGIEKAITVTVGLRHSTLWMFS